jgi:cytochrome c oxidase subunit 2
MRDGRANEARNEGGVKKLAPVAFIAMTLALAACSAGVQPQDTFDPAGEIAEKQKDLFFLVFWIGVGVFLVVEGGILAISLKYRHRRGHERMPSQIHGNTRLEVGWTILPAIVLAGVMIPTVGTIWDLAREGGDDALHVTVEGHQWWWGFQYTDPDMAVSYGDRGPIVTADVLVIPVDREVQLSLTAVGGLIGGNTPADADYAVVHSFWIPRLAGKQDAVPGRANLLVFRADEPGTYWGQCAEFCGLQHARMMVRVVALDQPDWDAWVANERQPAETPTDELAVKGMDLFLNGTSSGGQCIACHAVGGTDAASAAGPDLTHFAAETHECFSGCNWETADVEALEAWLRDPPAVKMGSKMPNYHLTEDEIDALVAYLYSLT